jgi:hypothetical protein
LIRMRRRIIAEAERFPDLASTWYDRGPATAVATLASVLAELAERGLLRVDDPTKAAAHGGSGADSRRHSKSVCTF